MRRVLFDTDLAMGAPGADIDDGFALALAIADPELTVELVTTVKGNTDVGTATRLSIDLLRRLGHGHIPVERGASGPLGARGRRRIPENGALPGGEVPRQHGALTMIERIMAEPGAFTIIAVGPLTNVALALLLEPRVAPAIQEIVVMGGAFFEHTNVSAMPGEFNIWSDPDAAAVVLASGAPLRFVGLDVTRKVRLTRDDAARLAATGGEFAPFAAACTDGWIDHQERAKPKEPLEHGSCALHDPLAVAVVTRPDLVTWQPAFVAVETTSQLTRGVMIADLLMRENPPVPNCQIATAVDAEAFRELFFQRIEGLP